MRLSDVITLLLFVSFWGVFFVQLGARVLRWLAIVQEKEYRTDRLRAFLRSTSGLSQLKHLFSKRSDLTRANLKRPKITARIALTALISFVSMIVVWVVLSDVLSYAIAAAVVVYVFSPAFILLSSFLINYVKRAYTQHLLGKVSLKIKASNPVVVGITGSFGKTSTKLFLAHLLEEQGSTLTTSGSINSLLGVARFLLKHFSNQKYLVLEYAAYKKGEIARLARAVEPDVAVITGITQQHLELFGTLEHIIEAKSELPAALKEEGAVYYPVGDASVERVAAAAPTARAVALHSSIYEKSHLDSSGRLQLQWYEHMIPTQLVGLQYASNCVLALEVARDLGVPTSQLIARASSFQPLEKYQTYFKTRSGVVVLDDSGTSNPAGFKAAIATAKQLKKSTAVLVTGGIPDLGAQSATIHAAIARQASGVFDTVLFTNAIEVQQFEAEFSGTFTAQQSDILKQLETLPKNTLLVIEGRVPGWLAPTLKKVTQS